MEKKAKDNKCDFLTWKRLSVITLLFFGERWTVGGNEEFERTHMQQNKKGNIYREKQLDRQKCKLSFDHFYLLNKMGVKATRP